MTRYRLPALLALLLPLVASAEDAPTKPTMASVLASAPAEDWMPVAADRLLELVPLLGRIPFLVQIRLWDGRICAKFDDAAADAVLR